MNPAILQAIVSMIQAAASQRRTQSGSGQPASSPQIDPYELGRRRLPFPPIPQSDSSYNPATREWLTPEQRYQGLQDAALGMESFAHGGVSRGGPALVGEEGPELLNLPPGAMIYPPGGRRPNYRQPAQIQDLLSLLAMDPVEGSQGFDPQDFGDAQSGLPPGRPGWPVDLLGEGGSYKPTTQEWLMPQQTMQRVRESALGGDVEQFPQTRGGAPYGPQLPFAGFPVPRHFTTFRESGGTELPHVPGEGLRSFEQPPGFGDQLLAGLGDVLGGLQFQVGPRAKGGEVAALLAGLGGLRAATGPARERVYDWRKRTASASEVEQARREGRLAKAQGDVALARERAKGEGALAAERLMGAIKAAAKPEAFDLSTPEGRQAKIAYDAEHAEAVAAAQRRGAPPIIKPAGVKPSTGEQKKVLGWYQRANLANQNLLSVEDRLGANVISGLQRKLAPNIFQTSDQQVYNQARRALAEAHLRRESGAAIRPEEYEEVDKTYLVQPGDKPEVIRQKKMNRDTLIRSLKFQSGSAYGEYYGTDEGTPDANVIYIMDENGDLRPE